MVPIMVSCADDSVARLDIDVSVGSNWSETYEFVDGDGLPVDCTGWAAVGTIRIDADTTVTTVCDPAAGDPSGVFTLSLDDSVTDTLPKGVYNWQLNLADGSDDIRWAEGKAHIKADIR